MASRRQLLRIAGLSALAGCVAAPTDPGEEERSSAIGGEAWSMVGVDAANSGNNLDASGPRETVRERWQQPLAGAWAPRPPTIRDGIVHTQAGTEVYAFDADDGDEQWVTDLGLKTYRFSPTIDEDHVYVAALESVDPDTPGGVFALERTSGVIDWEISNPTVDTTPKLVDGALFFTSLDRDGELTVHFHEAASGTERWTTTVTAEQEFRPTKRWPPAVADGSAFVQVPGAPELWSLDVTDGSINWSETFDEPLMSSTAVVDGTVYITDRSGTVHALDPVTGTKRRSIDTDDEFGPVTATPAVAGGIIVVEDYYRVLGLDIESGAERWSHRKNATENAYLGIADGVVYTGGRTTAAYDLEDGTEEWRWNPSGYYSLLTGCAVADERVYVNSCIKESSNDMYDHFVHALELA